MNRKRAPMPDVLKHILKRLNHRDETIREQAFQEALALPPEMLLRLMRPEATRSRDCGRMQTVLCSCGCLWILVCLVTVIGQFACHTAFLLWDALLFLCIPLFVGLIRKIDIRNQWGELLSRAILTQNDPRFMMPALLFYQHRETCLHEDIHQALLRLLPQLTLDDVKEWTGENTAALSKQIFWRSSDFDLWHDLEMLECALQTLGRVGSVEDVATVRRVARMTPEQIARKIHPNVLAEDRKEVYRAILDSTIINSEQHGSFDPENNAVMRDERYHYWCLNRAREIYALANCSLAALLERSEEQQHAAGLLRPSQATDDDAAHILLRPQIEASSQTPPEQLLRANTSKI